MNSPPLFRAGRRRGFTLVELLVVIAIITLLVSLVATAAKYARGASASTREIALGRQLITAYTAYATDNRGQLMPGFYGLNPALPATDERGNPLSGQTAHRWPWRLAPYLDFQLQGLVQDPFLLEDLRYTTQFSYFVSLYPSMGLNSVFMGGDSSSAGLGFNSALESLYGKIPLTRLSQAKRPADLIVFGSARTNAPYEPGAPPVIEGYFRITPPRMPGANWAQSWDPAAPASDWGSVSMRLDKRRAAFAFLDGHVGTLDDGEVRDMRRWSDRATGPDWVLGQ